MTNRSKTNSLQGLIVNNFPKNLGDDEIHKFLKNCIEDDIDVTNIKLSKSNKNMSATIEPLFPEQVQKATKLIHFPNCKQKFFQNPLYCRSIRTLSPEKSAPTPTETGPHEDSNPNPISSSLATESLSRPNPMKDLIVTPILEIKSKLFGNQDPESSSESDGGDDDLEDIREGFLKSEDEFSLVHKKARKKRERRSSADTSGKKPKKKNSRASKLDE